MKRLLIGSLLVLSLIAPAAVLNAQAGAITYGQTVTNALSAQAPQGFHTFNGVTGDVVVIYALGHEPGLMPSIALTGAAGQLAFSTDDPLLQLDNAAQIIYRLPQDGAYSIIVSSQGGTVGTYSLALRQRPLTVSIALTESTLLTIPQGAPSQQYSITAGPQPVPVTIASQPVGFEFSATLNNPDGQPIVVVAGGVESASFIIPAGEGVYELSLSAADPQQAGAIQVSLSGVAPAAGTPGVTGTPLPANACILTTTTGANLRQGPSIDYPVVGAITAGTTLVATGQNVGWFYANYNGQLVWIASSLVSAQGPCVDLPFVDAPLLVTATPSAVATEAVTEQITETATQATGTVTEVTATQATVTVTEVTATATPTQVTETATETPTQATETPTQATETPTEPTLEAPAPITTEDPAG